jgi:hypothetical protein
MRAQRVLSVLAAVVAIGVACEDTVTGIPAGLEVFTANLNGANERPNPVTTTATGTAIVTVLGNQLSWKVDILTAIDSVNAGHIHRHHPDTAAGGVIKSLAPTSTDLDFTGTLALGSALDTDSVVAIMRAGRAYVNIHTLRNGGGEIRGQLVKQ